MNHHASFSVSEALYELLLNEAVLIVYGFPDATVVSHESKTNHIDLEHGFYRMESIGFEVGQRWIERYVVGHGCWLEWHSCVPMSVYVG